MLSGSYQGQLLSFISQMIKPKTILEIGTYVGYSAICLAKGLQENGKLITLDNNEELETTIANNINTSFQVFLIHSVYGIVILYK